MRRVLAWAVAAALVLTACQDTTTDAGDEAIDDGPSAPWTTCVAEGYRVEYPPEWHTNEGDVMPPCSLFDPEPVTVEPATQVPLDIAVFIRIEPVGFDAVGSEDPHGEEVIARQDNTVDGKRAVRSQARSTGEALVPAGVETTRWVVDLEDRTLHASAHDVGQPDYEEKQEVLDYMIDSLRFGEDAVDPATTTTAAPTTTTTVSEDGPEPVGDPSTATVRSPGFPGGLNGDTAYLVDVRAAARQGFDRVVLEFDGDEAPAYRVGYVEPPVREEPPGREVQVEGEAYLEVRVQPASAVDRSGDEARQTYQGPDRVPVRGGNVATEAVQTGDRENDLAWVVGLRRQVPFGVAMLESPPRLVVDVVPEQPRPVLRRGERGEAVEELQRRLERLRYWVGPNDGVYGQLTQQAVYAFQKYTGLTVDGMVDQDDWSALVRAPVPEPRSDAGDLVEVDKSRQLIFIVGNGSTEWLLNTSTGREEPYTKDGQRYDAETPTGRYEVFRQIDGWRESSFGRLYRPKYFTTNGIAVHGYPNVPPRPASAGCVRVTIEAMDYLWDQDLIPIGTNVWVYGQIPQ